MLWINFEHHLSDEKCRYNELILTFNFVVKWMYDIRRPLRSFPFILPQPLTSNNAVRWLSKFPFLRCTMFNIFIFLFISSFYDNFIKAGSVPTQRHAHSLKWYVFWKKRQSIIISSSHSRNGKQYMCPYSYTVLA